MAHSGFISAQISECHIMAGIRNIVYLFSVQMSICHSEKFMVGFSRKNKPCIRFPPMVLGVHWNWSDIIPHSCDTIKSGKSLNIVPSMYMLLLPLLSGIRLGLVADMLSDWKGQWPAILKQPGENTAAQPRTGSGLTDLLVRW